MGPLPGLGDAFQARGNIDAVDHQITVALLDHIVEINADAKLDLALRRERQRCARPCRSAPPTATIAGRCCRLTPSNAKSAMMPPSPSLWIRMASSGLDVAGQFTAIGCKLPHDLLMQPDIHGGRVIRVASVFQFAGELLASRQAAVETESLH